MNIPPDDQLPAGNLDAAPLPDDLSLAGKKGSKAPLIIVGVLIAAGLGYFIYSSRKTLEERKVHASFLEHFQAWEKDDLLKFWVCTLGPNTDGATVPSPDAITAKIDQQFASDFKAYPGKLREECAKLAKDAADKLSTLGALPEYTGALQTYAKSVTAISDALEDWAKVAPEQIQSKMVAKNAEDYGNAWHAYQGGAATPEIIAYDLFLHCADADLEKHKDNLELAKHLFEQCKQAPFRERMQNECGKLVTDKPTAPTKNWKQVLQKIGADSKDVDAVGDCLKKARKGKLKDNLAPVGMRWVAFREAREAVLKIGKDALKE